ncbi:MAG: DHH family phosphoesterase [Gammaproteobacteria bacterium]|nr:DHH family phosphoesterase [Gammaproteobacteria bacterium]
MQIDCFNGDADGICALTQLRLHKPIESQLISGVKRDINLLSRVDAGPQDQITVLDVSLDKNRKDLNRLLHTGAAVFYCDHHFAGDIPDSNNLQTIINSSADVCTSLLINKYLDGAFLDWAVVGTFGDNLKRSATILAKPLGLSSEQLRQLEKLGIYLNYNGYGASLEDLYFHPDALFQRTVQYSSAFDFINEDKETFGVLEEGYHDDMRKADASDLIYDNSSVSIYQLPNQSWARRVSGVFGNELANANPNKAHAVLTEKGNDELLVSVRAPLHNKYGADEVCRQFQTGGGRAAAAGINALPLDQIDNFIQTLSDYYQ